MCGFGGSAEAIMEGACVASFRSQVGGPRGRNRVFVGPIAEGSQQSGFFVSGLETQVNDAWVAFRAAIIDNDAACQQLVVSYTHADAHPIVSNSTMSNIGTQRRRLTAQR
jgi:hypothetical protein